MLQQRDWVGLEEVVTDALGRMQERLEQLEYEREESGRLGSAAVLMTWRLQPSKPQQQLLQPLQQEHDDDDDEDRPVYMYGLARKVCRCDVPVVHMAGDVAGADAEEDPWNVAAVEARHAKAHVQASDRCSWSSCVHGLSLVSQQQQPHLCWYEFWDHTRMQPVQLLAPAMGTAAEKEGGEEDNQGREQVPEQERPPDERRETDGNGERQQQQQLQQHAEDAEVYDSMLMSPFVVCAEAYPLPSARRAVPDSASESSAASATCVGAAVAPAAVDVHRRTQSRKRPRPGQLPPGQQQLCEPEGGLMVTTSRRGRYACHIRLQFLTAEDHHRQQCRMQKRVAQTQYPHCGLRSSPFVCSGNLRAECSGCAQSVRQSLVVRCARQPAGSASASASASGSAFASVSQQQQQQQHQRHSTLAMNVVGILVDVQTRAEEELSLLLRDVEFEDVVTVYVKSGCLPSLRLGAVLLAGHVIQRVSSRTGKVYLGTTNMTSLHVLGTAMFDGAAIARARRVSKSVARRDTHVPWADLLMLSGLRQTHRTSCMYRCRAQLVCVQFVQVCEKCVRCMRMHERCECASRPSKQVGGNGGSSAAGRGQGDENVKQEQRHNDTLSAGAGRKRNRPNTALGGVREASGAPGEAGETGKVEDSQRRPATFLSWEASFVADDGTAQAQAFADGTLVPELLQLSVAMRRRVEMAVMQSGRRVQYKRGENSGARSWGPRGLAEACAALVHTITSAWRSYTADMIFRSMGRVLSPTGPAQPMDTSRGAGGSSNSTRGSSILSTALVPVHLGDVDVSTNSCGRACIRIMWADRMRQEEARMHSYRLLNGLRSATVGDSETRASKMAAQEAQWASAAAGYLG